MNFLRRRIDTIILLLLLVVAGLVFINTPGGDFVYDDNWQIVQNYLIQDSDLLLDALSSDVWAFRGDGESVISNYWRPAFVLLMAMNYQLFGLENTAGWHIVNILLHALTVGIAYGLLRSLKLSTWLAGAIALIFAVHPAHVETVTWVSGAPDLILAPAFLGALWLLILAYPHEARNAPARPRSRRSRRQNQPAAAPDRSHTGMIIAAGLLSALAMAAKEIGIVFPLVAAVTVFARQGDSRLALDRRLLDTGRKTWPFFLVAAVYFLLRTLVLEGVSRPQLNVSALETLLTIPAVLTFYLRQSLFPYLIGPLYPLRIVEPAGLTAANFWLPILVLIVAAAIVVWMVKQGDVPQIGFALFLFPLLPALNFSAFTADRLVHDRYLYLSLLGLLMMVIPALAGLLSGRLGWAESRAGAVCLAGAALASIPLAIQTLTYNRAWQSDLALWEWGLRTDLDSSFGWSQYSNALRVAGRTAEARTAMDNAIRLAGEGEFSANQLMTNAEIAIAEGRLDDAEALIQQAVSIEPLNYQLHERWAVIYREKGELNNAALILQQARERIPNYYCGFTTNLGVIYYLGGDQQQALEELERIRELAPQEPNVICRMGLIHLARLYAELNRPEDARAALNLHEALTATLSDENTREQRALAEQIREQLR